LFVLPLICGAGTANAGFDFTTLGQSSNSMPSATAAPIFTPPIEEIQMDGTPLEKSADAKKPALEIFNEKYVPDVVRKKYDLKDDWYGESSPVDVTPPTISVEPVPEPVTAPMTNPLPAQGVKPEIKSESWRARKGETLRDVLQRWSERGGTNLMWASPEVPVLQKDFTYLGDFQDAANALIKESGGANIHSQYRTEGLSPVMMAPASTVTTNSPAPLPNNVAVMPKEQNLLSKVFMPEEEKIEKEPETRWFGLSGAPLAEIVRVWSEDAGVTLVWQSEKNFALKESISQVGKFEDAIFKALSQYDGEPIRPVGEMYNDPQTGRRVLVVRTDINS
jgi:hypothetical protein